MMKGTTEAKKIQHETRVYTHVLFFLNNAWNFPNKIIFSDHTVFNPEELSNTRDE